MNENVFNAARYEKPLPRLPDLTDDQKRVLLAEAQGWTVEAFGKRKGFPNGVHLMFKTDNEDEQGQIIPDYLHDERAAITLCDMLADKGWDCHASKRPFKGDWLVQFEIGQGETYQSVIAVSTSLATAISHAALKALNLAV